MKDLVITGLVCLLLGFTVGDKHREFEDRYIDSQNQTIRSIVEPPEAPTPNSRPAPEHNIKWTVVPIPEADQEVPIANMHLTVFIGKDKRYVTWFDEHSGLARLKEMSNFNVISIYDHRFPRYKIKTVPAVLLQNKNGRVIYSAAGMDLPIDSSTLYGHMQKQIALCPWFKPKPKPQPDRGKPVKPIVVPPPDIVIDPPQRESLNPILFAVLALAGSGFGYYNGKDEA